MNERLRRRELQNYYLYFLMGLFLLTSCQPKPVASSENSFNVAVTKDLQHTASLYLDHPNPTIKNAMEDIVSFTQGESLTWDDCQNVNFQVETISAFLEGNPLMGITSNTEIVKHDDIGNITVKAQWATSPHLWLKYQTLSPEVLWHEAHHLWQFCKIVKQIEETDLIAANQIFELSLNSNRAFLEAEVIGTQVYWYLRSNKSYQDIIILSSLNNERENLNYISLWQHFFSTDEERIWEGIDQLSITENETNFYLDTIPINSKGLPELNSHPNWDSWVEAIDEIYIKRNNLVSNE